MRGVGFHQRHLWSPGLLTHHLQEFFSFCPIPFQPLSLGHGPAPLRAITDSFCASSELALCKISSMFCSAFKISSCLVSALFLLGIRAWRAHPLVLQTCSHTLRSWGKHSSASHCNFCYQHEVTFTLWIRDDRWLWAESLWRDVEIKVGAKVTLAGLNYALKFNVMRWEASRKFPEEEEECLGATAQLYFFSPQFQHWLSLWLSFNTYVFPQEWITLCLLCEERNPVKEKMSILW